LVRDGGFAHAQQGGNIADAHFRVQERGYYPHPRGIAEHLKQLGKVKKQFLAGHPVFDFLNNSVM
jgi:hypothetical protein